jgi:hypothetical protein
MKGECMNEWLIEIIKKFLKTSIWNMFYNVKLVVQCGTIG